MNSNQKKSHEVYLNLKNKILDLEFPPNHRVSEVQIGEQYNASRTPIKQAFTKLEFEKLIYVKPNVGTFVSKIDYQNIEELLDMRYIFELHIIKSLQNGLNIVQIQELNLIIAKQEFLLQENPSLTLSNSRSFMLLDNLFHQTVYQFAKKNHIWNMIEDNSLHYTRYRLLANSINSTRIKQKILEHKQIISFLTGDLIDIEELFESHLIKDFLFDKQNGILL